MYSFILSNIQFNFCLVLRGKFFVFSFPDLQLLQCSFITKVNSLSTLKNLSALLCCLLCFLFRSLLNIFSFFTLGHFFCRNVNGKCFHSIFSSQVIILNFLDKTSLCVMFMFFCVYKRPPCVCLLKQLNRVTEKKFNMMKLNC